MHRTQYETLAWDQRHEQCSQGGDNREESKEVLKTRLAPMDAAEAKRIPVGGIDTNAAETINGKRKRAPAQGAPTQAFGKTSRVGGLHLVFVAVTEEVR